eukprot:s584_g17.t1
MLGQNELSLHDRHDGFLPLTLQLDPAAVHDYGIRLADMIRSWHGELGMQAALTSSPELVCVHIDRMLLTPLGTLQKLRTPVTFCWAIELPVFDSASDTQWTWVPYQMVAAFSHSGDVTGGHYQALLRTDCRAATPDDQEGLWLHCDDHRPPQRCWNVPPGFHEGVTCIWLCHCDVLALHRMPSIAHPGTAPHEGVVITRSVVTPSEDSTTGDNFLAMFASDRQSRVDDSSE